MQVSKDATVLQDTSSIWTDLKYICWNFKIDGHDYSWDLLGTVGICFGILQ